MSTPEGALAVNLLVLELQPLQEDQGSSEAVTPLPPEPLLGAGVGDSRGAHTQCHPPPAGL